MSRLLEIVAFGLMGGAFYAASSIMAVRLWRLVRSGVLVQTDAWPAAAWCGALLLSLLLPPVIVVVVPAAYVLCYRRLARGSDGQATNPNVTA